MMRRLQAGVPAQKLLLGLPIFGRTWLGCDPRNLRRAPYLCGATEPYLAAAGGEGRLHDGGPADDPGCLL
jgi:GH18 family chitinase